MARILVGLPTVHGDIRKYQKRFDVVELHPVDTPLPRPSTLRSWRKAVPPGFVFSIVLPKAVSALTPGRALDEALQATLDVATTVEARCLLLPTMPDIRPTAANRKRLAAVLERLPRAGVVIAWEPRGMWEVDDIIATARSIDALPVLDAAHEALPPGPIVYTRLRALGGGGQLSTAAIDRVAASLRGRRESFVIVEGRGDAARVKVSLEQALARGRSSIGAGHVVRPAPTSIAAEDEEQ